MITTCCCIFVPPPPPGAFACRFAFKPTSGLAPKPWKWFLRGCSVGLGLVLLRSSPLLSILILCICLVGEAARGKFWQCGCFPCLCCIAAVAFAQSTTAAGVFHGDFSPSFPLLPSTPRHCRIVASFVAFSTASRPSPSSDRRRKRGKSPLLHRLRQVIKTF